MGDDVRAPFERTEQIRRGEGVVNHQNEIVFLGDRRYFFKREDGDIGVAESLAVDNFCVGLNRRFEILRVSGVNESNVNSQLGQCVLKLAVGSTIQTGRGHDVVTCIAQGEDRLCLRSMT